MLTSRFVLAIACLAGSVLYGQQFKNPDNLAPDFPTPELVVDRMLELAQIRPNEIVYDLGCGDGRIVITAARKFNARAVGIEMARDIFERTSARVLALNLQDRVTIIHGNALHTDLSHADVVTLYLLTSSNDRLRPRLEHDLHVGSRVVSHDYEIRGWEPKMVDRINVAGRKHTIYLYEVKAH